MTEFLQDKISQLPLKPGVYQYKNANGTIIYVGKAIKLRNRVKSYFQEGRPKDAKTKALVQHICDVEVIVTDTEAEALILENNLIKEHKPKYNIMLRDDKTYPYVRITNELYPRVFQTRTIVRDGSKYFGPYTEVSILRSLMKTLKVLFKIRSCELNISDKSIVEQKHRVCLDFHINKCDGPCEGKIDSAIYQNNIKQAMTILSGKTREIEKYLEERMNYFAENLRFEEAAELRNKLNILKDFSSKQKVVSTELIDRDIFAIARQDETACTIVLKVRDGKLIGKMHYIVSKANEFSDCELIQRTVEKWYLENDFIPSDIFLPCEADDFEYLTSWLAEKKGKTVYISIPKIGDKRKIIEMAETNATFILKEYLSNYDKREQMVPRHVQSLHRDLNLKKIPRIIECFDNSHLQGSDLVSSMVYFEDGKPNKAQYRKYKNKTVLKNDDFAAMREAVYRRYSRILQAMGELDFEDDSEISEKETNKVPKRLPDLIIIDGGKGQLNSAVEILEQLGIKDRVEIVGLAKRLEEVFFPGEKESIILPRTSSSLRLIQHLRDEAHRFAITFHRSLRDKRTFKTALTEIEGIGEKTAQKLLKEIGSIEKVRNSDEELLLKYLNKRQTLAILEYFASTKQKKD